jgi:hypothetical protein
MQKQFLAKCTHPAEYLRERIQQLRLTHRQFAHQMGLKSSATLNHILSGRRRILEYREVRDQQGRMLRDAMGKPILEDCMPHYGRILQLNERELFYFRMLVRSTYSESELEKSSCEEQLELLRLEFLQESSASEPSAVKRLNFQVPSAFAGAFEERLAELRAWVASLPSVDDMDTDVFALQYELAEA